MLNAFMLFLMSVGPIGILLGLFFGAIVANASLFLPLPIDLIVIPLSSIDFLGLGILTPLIIGLVVGFGASIGEFSGYFIGFAGVKSFESMKKHEIEKLKLLKEKLEITGIPLILFFAFTPLPFDLIGVAAGLAKFSKKKFFIGCFLGKVPRYIILAYAGYFSISFILRLFGG